jgi:hypothetical protein
VSEVEVLEATPTRRWSRRRWVVVAAVALVLGGTAYAVDHRARTSEEQALADCGDRAAAAVEQAYAPVNARLAEVGPPLNSGVSLMVRYSLYRRLSESARGRSAIVERAREECAGVSILPTHPDLARRRDDCVRLLGEHADFLSGVEQSGPMINAVWPEPFKGC